MNLGLRHQFQGTGVRVVIDATLKICRVRLVVFGITSRGGSSCMDAYVGIGIKSVGLCWGFGNGGLPTEHWKWFGCVGDRLWRTTASCGLPCRVAVVAFSRSLCRLTLVYKWFAWSMMKSCPKASPSSPLCKVPTIVNRAFDTELCLSPPAGDDHSCQFNC